MADEPNSIGGDAAVANIGKSLRTNNTGSLQWISYSIGQSAIAQHVHNQRKELADVRTEMNKVRDLQKLQQLTAVVGDDDSSINITFEINDLLQKAQECGTILPDYKNNFLTNEQRVDLQDRLRHTVENLNQDNDMRLQGISRLTNVLHEMYALMRTVMRTGHEIMKTVIRKIDPRG